MERKKKNGKSIKIAAIQMSSNPSDQQGNLEKARRFVKDAASKGAEMILLPEFFGCGYTYELKGRKLCEPLHGKTGSFLKNLSKELGVWIGGCIYEWSQKGCFDTFLLVSPDGKQFTHRKRVPVFCESFFFEPGDDPIVVETDLGRIALVICAESTETSLLREVSQSHPDLVLIGYASPGPSPALAKIMGGPPPDIIRRISRRWAESCGAPVAASCTSGLWQSGLPGVPVVKLKLQFLGQSGIYDSSGKELAGVETVEGIASSEVELKSSNPTLKIPDGRYVEPLPRAVTFIMDWTNRIGTVFYPRWNKKNLHSV